MPVLSGISRETCDSVSVYGFMCGVYGSAIYSDTPRDIDLILFPWRPVTATDARSAINEIARRLGEKTRGEEYRGHMGTLSVQIATKSGIVYDIQARLQGLSQ